MKKRFYTELKIILTVASFFLLITMGAGIYTNVQSKQWGIVLLCIGCTIFIAIPIASFIYIYYRKVVIDVKFFDDIIIIITNGKTYRHKVYAITKVVKESGKILIFCKSEKGQKKYIYQTIYFPHKEEIIDVKLWKDKLPFTVFSGF